MAALGYILVRFVADGFRLDDEFQPIAFYVALVALVGIIGLVHTIRAPADQPEIERVRQAKEREAQVIADQRAVERERKWYFRYPVAALFLFVAYYTAQSGRLPWWIAVGAVIAAAIYAWELALLALGIAAFVGFFGAAAAMPTSAAIIVGAIIIAMAISSKR